MRTANKGPVQPALYLALLLRLWGTCEREIRMRRRDSANNRFMCDALNLLFLRIGNRAITSPPHSNGLLVGRNAQNFARVRQAVRRRAVFLFSFKQHLNFRFGRLRISLPINS